MALFAAQFQSVASTTATSVSRLHKCKPVHRLSRSTQVTADSVTSLPSHTVSRGYQECATQLETHTLLLLCSLTPLTTPTSTFLSFGIISVLFISKTSLR